MFAKYAGYDQSVAAVVSAAAEYHDFFPAFRKRDYLLCASPTRVFHHLSIGYPARVADAFGSLHLRGSDYISHKKPPEQINNPVFIGTGCTIVRAHFKRSASAISCNISENSSDLDSNTP